MLKLIIGPLNYSSWSVRPWLALKHAGLPFEEVQIDFESPTAKEEILRYSGAGTVPVLLNGEAAVWVSLAIGETVAELAPEARLLPEDLPRRGHCRSVSAEMVGGFAALRQNMPMNARAHYPGKSMTPEVEADIRRITQIWRECRERYVSEGPFLFGGFSIADCMYAPVASRFLTYGVSLGAVERDYVAALQAHPAVQEWYAIASRETTRIPEYEMG